MKRLFVVALLLLALRSYGQTIEYNRPQLEWMTFETEHFIIHYVKGLEDVAALAAKIAEEIHGPLCDAYEYRPDTKVSLIFSDEDDIANAGSYFQSNKIKFFATSMSWDFRGTHNWLRNVVTHEYTHMIQLGASRKWARKLPAFYFQLLGYELERRPDVLYGYPNTLISWPLPSVTIPAWFAEGTAQYQFKGSGYDFWDSHRDMLLRQATLSDRLLSWDDMCYFGKTSLESEGVYNQGFHFVRFIADRSNGVQTLRDISHKMTSIWPVSLNDAISSATGKSGVQWYREWKGYLESHYGSLRSALEPSFSLLDTLPTSGFVNTYPRLSPDGSRVAFISNENRDYFGQSSLYVWDSMTDSVEQLTPAAQGGLCWLPDSSGILFSRRSTANRDASLLHDIFLYRFSDEKTVRLSQGLRAESVDISPDGRFLLFTINEAGRREIAIASTPDLTAKRIRPFEQQDVLLRLPSLPHEQFYLPRWSPNGDAIAVSRHREEGRSVRVYAFDREAPSLTLENEFSCNGAELRDPSWSADGKSLLVSYDESGIANIYRLDIEAGEKTRLTCVLGGAFYPELRDNQLFFSEFCENGFRICRLNDPQPLRLPVSSLDAEDSSAYMNLVPKSEFSFDAPIAQASPYKPTFESLYWFPRIAFDYGTFKPGAYLMLNDVLDKLTFIGGLAANSNSEYDIYGLAEYHAFYPTIFAEYFNIQRRLTSHFPDSTRIIGEEYRTVGNDSSLYPLFDDYRIRFRYNLNEVSVGLGIPLGASSNLKTRATYDQYVAHNRFDDETSVSLSYFKGWSWKAGYYFDKRRPGLLTDISPSAGYRGFLEYTRANHNFIKDIEIGGDAIGLREIYDPNNYGLLEGGIEKYFASPVKSHSMEFRLRGGYIDEAVDPFFYQYAGGLPGMRGYSFYSLGGTRTAVGTFAYRFPIVNRTATSLWPLSINRIYGSLFTDVGDAWTGDYEDRGPKKDVGAGLRLQMHSFYSYPTALTFDVAYGFDEFDVIEDEVRTGYGHEFRYYLTVLFDFYTPIIPPARHPSSCKCPGCSTRNK